MEPDFSGWATKHGLVCSDGLTIGADAFRHADKQRVPLVWQHQHGGVSNILGHAILEYRDEGVYCRAYFNDTEDGQHAKTMVQHGDVDALSIFANGLRKQGNLVVHGNIREVSLVIAGANPGAFIEKIHIAHSSENGDFSDGEAIIHTGLELVQIAHSEGDDDVADDNSTDSENDETIEDEATADSDQINDDAGDGTVEHADSDGEDEESIDDILDTLNDKQRGAVNYVLEKMADAGVLKDDNNDDSSLEQSEDQGGETVAHTNQEGTSMHSIFANGGPNASTSAAQATLSHDQLGTIFSDAKSKNMNLSEAVLAHAGTFGIDNIELLFPDAKALDAQPQLIARRVEWVDKVLAGVKRIPFAKVKSIVFDLTADEARAKGYIKGKLKKEEVLPVLRRTTGPTTIYKKQKLDRDDIIDITDFDIVAWLKWEIRYMLDEELARAILIGDGRPVDDDDKIKDPAGANSGDGIRSILHDHEMYSIKVQLPANISAEDSIDAITRARVDYRGTGNPTFFTSDRYVTDLLLLKDKMGRRLYGTDAELGSALRVSDIVTVPVFDEEPELFGIIVNLIDYSVGTNRGGEINFFDDFDIDYNQNKYLMETRCSGALTRPFSAIVLKRQQGTSVTPTVPSFDAATNKVTIPTKAGVTYSINGEAQSAGQKTITEDTTVKATPDAGYYIPAGQTTEWSYSFTAPQG